MSSLFNLLQIRLPLLRCIVSSCLLLLLTNHIIGVTSQSIFPQTTPSPSLSASPTPSTISAQSPRSVISCNHGVHREDIGITTSFVSTYPDFPNINSCLQRNSSSISLSCSNTSSTISQPLYFNDTQCTVTDNTVQADPLWMETDCALNINTINNNQSTSCPSTITLTQYHKNESVADGSCSKDLSHPLTISYIFALEVCIPLQLDLTAKAIYNAYNATTMTLSQFEYQSLNECLNDSSSSSTFGSNPFTITSSQCLGSYFFEITPIPSIPSVTTTTSPPTTISDSNGNNNTVNTKTTNTPSTEPTVEPTIEPSISSVLPPTAPNNSTTPNSNITRSPSSSSGPTAEPTLEPTFEPTLEPTIAFGVSFNPTVSPTVNTSIISSNTSTNSTDSVSPSPSTSSTNQSRSVISCEYAIFNSSVISSVIDGTIPADTCVIGPLDTLSNVSHTFECHNGIMTHYTSNPPPSQCGDTTNRISASMDSFTSYCNNASTDSTPTTPTESTSTSTSSPCTFGLIGKFWKDLDSTECLKSSFIADSLLNVIPFIPNVCIPAANGVVFNHYDWNRTSDVVQYGYSSMSDCLNDTITNRSNTSIIGGKTCDSTFYYQVITPPLRESEGVITGNTGNGTTTNVTVPDSTGDVTSNGTAITLSPTLEPTDFPSWIPTDFPTIISAMNDTTAVALNESTTSNGTLSGNMSANNTCFYALWLDTDSIPELWYQSIVLDVCYDGYDDLSDEWSISSEEYSCRETSQILKAEFYFEKCEGDPDNVEPANSSHSNLQQNCDFEGDTSSSSSFGVVEDCSYVWLLQYDSLNSRCGPDTLIQRRAVVLNHCLEFTTDGTIIKNIMNANGGIYTLYFSSMVDCALDQYTSSTFIPNDGCDDGYYYLVNWPSTNSDSGSGSDSDSGSNSTTKTPTSSPTTNVAMNSNTTTTTESFNYTITTESELNETNSPTVTPTSNVSSVVDGNTNWIQDLPFQCNMAITLGGESNFYETYVMDRCYDNEMMMESHQYECDNDNGDGDGVNKFAWSNTGCSLSQDSFTSGVTSESVSVDITVCNAKDESDDTQSGQCPFVWMKQYYAYDGCTAPFTSTMERYAMILDQCMAHTEEGYGAFLNVYFSGQNTEDEDGSRLVQLHYNTISDCLDDDGVPLSNTTFIHESCTKGIADGMQYWYEFEIPEVIESVPTSSPTTTPTLNVIAINNTMPDGTDSNSDTTMEPMNTSMSSVETTAVDTDEFVMDSVCNHVISENFDLDIYWTAVEDKCYESEFGSSQYHCSGGDLMVEVMWNHNTKCSGIQTNSRPISSVNSYCSATNDMSCSSVIPVTQYRTNGNCTKLQLVQEYTLILNQCLQYKDGDSETVFVFNELDDGSDPIRLKQTQYGSYTECVEDDTVNDTIEIVDGHCINGFYYGIGTLPPETTHVIVETDHVVDDAPFYEDAYSSIFGPEGPTTIEVDIILLAVIVIVSCFCCGVMCWCGWLKGINDCCWNMICCGRYQRIKVANKAKGKNAVGDDSGDEDSVEMGNVVHVPARWFEDDNQELARLSEPEKKRNAPRKPGRNNRL